MTVLDSIRGAVGAPTISDRPKAIVAAAVQLDNSPRSMRMVKQTQPWQQRAWTGYESVGEVMFGVDFIGDVVSQLNLFVGVRQRPGDDPQPVADGEHGHAREMLDRIADPDGSHAGLMRELAINLTVAAEGYIHGHTHTDDGSERWEVRSIDEIEATSTSIKLVEDPADIKSKRVLDLPPADPNKVDPNHPYEFLARVWLPHPRRSILAQSPIRGVLSSIEELLLYERMIRSQVTSRLAGAGLLLMPDEISFDGPDIPATDSGEQEQEDPFYRLLMQAMSTAVDREGHPSEYVPILVRAAAEHLDTVRHVSFSSPLDDALLARIDAAIRRIAQGLPVPPEVLLGTADVNHWRSDAETEIFTEHGWLTYDQIVPGMQCLSLRHDRGVAAWEPLAGVVIHEVEEEALAITARSHNSLTSLDHRWPVLTSQPGGQRGAKKTSREWIVSEDFEANSPTDTGVNHAMLLAVPVDDVPTEPKWSDDMVRLFAYLSTGGDVKPGRGRPVFRLRQRKPEMVEAVRSALTGAGFGFSEGHDSLADVVWFQMHTQDTADVMACGDQFGTRWAVGLSTIREFTHAQLLLFLDAAQRMNGGDNDGRTVFAVDPRRLECIEAAALLAGFRCTTRQRNQQTGFGSEPVWRCTWGTQETFTPRPHHIERVPYKGVMWCPRLPIGASFLARRRGQTFWTGNTAWQIERSTWKQIEPLAQAIVRSLTVHVWRPLIEAGGSDPDGLTIWYDPKKILDPTPTNTDVFQAHDRLIISDAGARKRLGIADIEEPDPEEFRRRILTKAAVGAPSVGLPILQDELEGAGSAGTMPDPADTAPPADDPAVAAARASALRTLIADGSGEQIGRRLADIDRSLYDRLDQAAQDVVDRALEKAGARLRSRAAKDATLSQALSGVDNREVAATLGQRVVSSFGVEETDLVADAVADLRATFDRLVRDAQQQAIDVAIETGASEEQADRVAAELAEERDRAWQWLFTTLVGVVTARLYSPRPRAPDAGEVEVEMRVPFGTIREAVARAGGNAGRSARSGVAALGALGVATGQRIADLLKSAQVVRTGFTWDYRHAISRRTFHPHMALHGLTVEDGDDPALTNNLTFPPYSHFFPGDHDGCRCALVPLMAPASVAGPSSV